MRSAQHLLTIKVPRVSQQTDSHCGPAVIQMLYSNLSTKYTQDEIVEAAGITKTIKAKGSRPAQLAKAVKKLTPNIKYLFKQNATKEDLETLITVYKIPVAVNWQGLFYERPEQETPSDKRDRGHYSIVTGINVDKDELRMADPYPSFSKKRRTFSLTWFSKRWRDTVRDKNKETSKVETIKTKHFLFILAPSTIKFPKQLGLLPASKLDILKVEK